MLYEISEFNVKKQSFHHLSGPIHIITLNNKNPNSIR